MFMEKVCPFCMEMFSKVMEHIYKKHTDTPVEIRAKRMAKEAADSKVRSQSYANLSMLILTRDIMKNKMLSSSGSL